MKNLNRILMFLKSLWGVLTTATVLFPGAAALLKLPIAVQNSKIATLYPTIGIIVSAFALLLLTAYRDRLVVLDLARRWATFSMVVAMALFFSFVLVRVFVLNVDYENRYLDSARNVEVWFARSRGIIGERETRLDGKVEATVKSERGDPWDVLSLVFFTGSFASLTVAFGVLGLHAYEVENRKRVR